MGLPPDGEGEGHPFLAPLSKGEHGSPAFPPWRKAHALTLLSFGGNREEDVPPVVTLWRQAGPCSSFRPSPS